MWFGVRSWNSLAALMSTIPKLVFSKTLQTVNWNNSTLIQENADVEIKKRKGVRDMYIFSSANLSETFINTDLFDEYRINIAPIILGSGRPLFRQGIASQNLSLVSTQPFLKGGTVLTYSR